MRRVCVTGTNGKTTTTSLIDAIVAASGAPSARVTTLGAFVRGQRLSDGMTRAAFDEAVHAAAAAGVEILAIETTSKALAGGFARRNPPEVAVFTNLTRDHLDTHGTPERYLAAKAQLFLALGSGGTAILNACDPAAARLDKVISRGVRRLAYAARAVAPECRHLPVVLASESVLVDREGTTIELAASDLAQRLGGRLRLQIVGSVHADNALAAAVAAEALGLDAAAVRVGLASFAGVPGRFEIVARRPLVAVDYAHTPDALARTLQLARGLSGGARVLVVFGCGGDRDRGKRPEMGRIADELADEVFLTTDNPRREDPRAIADAVFGGAGPRARWVREPDRAAAIAQAIEAASAADVVVIAGKGHERTQSIGDALLPFSDVDVARVVCDRRTCGSTVRSSSAPRS